ncbi:MAG: hypothetical protein KTR30_31535 [Saprospiraceae bacterium]|nr:hypothetical protein [Saprospiraceae bacterium]
MIHRSTLANYDKGLQQLAEELGDLRYDALVDFLQYLHEKLAKDSKADEERGRAKLAKCLALASNNIGHSAKEIQKAWIISEPYM